MNGIDVLLDLAGRPSELLGYMRKSLTPELLTRHPNHDNSPGWLIWHAARQLDVQLSALTGVDQVWSAQAFGPRLNMDISPDDMGFEHTPEQARAVVIEDVDGVVAYLEEVVAAQVSYIRSLDDKALSDIIDDSWDPPVTRGARLVSISCDAMQHLAQVMYVAGMSRD